MMRSVGFRPIEEKQADADTELFERIYHLIEEWDKTKVENFSTLLNQAFSNEGGKNHTNKSYHVCQIIVKQGKERKKPDVLDYLEAILKECPGSHGPHSFKFTLLAKLFGLSELDQKNADKVVTCFIKAIDAYKKNERKMIVKDVIGDLRSLSPHDFDQAVKTAFNLKQAIEQEKNVVYGLTLHVRGFIVNYLSKQVESEQIDVLDAVRDVLAMPLAQRSLHSFKFIFLLCLLGCQFKEPGTITYEDLLACVKSDKAIVRRILAKTDKGSEEVTLLLDEMVEYIDQLKRDQCEAIKGEIEQYVASCFDLSVAGLRQAVDSLREEKAKNNTLSPVHFFGKKVREWVEDPVFNHLLDVKAEDKTAIPRALFTFLSSTFISSDPHSSKYALLTKLFSNLNKNIQVTEKISTFTVQTFIEKLKIKIDEADKEALSAQLSSRPAF